MKPYVLLLLVWGLIMGTDGDKKASDEYAPFEGVRRFSAVQL